MLKEAVVEGPSLVFTRYHEEGQTKIRDHQYEDARLCKKILGYDAKALYLSAILKDMPCGKERVVHYNNNNKGIAAAMLTHKVKAGTWFGFAEVDIEIPEHLRTKFEEMCPLFLNKEVRGNVPILSEQRGSSRSCAAAHERLLGTITGRTRVDGKKLVGALTAKKLLLYAPLLRWYIDHGAYISKLLSNYQLQT